MTVRQFCFGYITGIHLAYLSSVLTRKITLLDPILVFYFLFFSVLLTNGNVKCELHTTLSELNKILRQIGRYPKVFVLISLSISS